MLTIVDLFSREAGSGKREAGSGKREAGSGKQEDYEINLPNHT